MELEILQNNFETVYKEYKEYESFIKSTAEEIKKQRENFRDKVINEEHNEETLIKELFDLSIKPIQSEEDLRILRDRLVSVYDAYKIIIDFPQEIKDEMLFLRRPYQAYRIYNGEQIEIDKDKNEKFKEEARKNHSEIIKSLKNQ